MTRTVVGMSGGVDSSLAAALLKEQGREVVGVTMKLWPCAEQDGGFAREDACCSPTETIDARAVALGVGLPHYVVDLEDRFRADVVDGFVAGYARGETPNPCVRCNEKIKFGALWDYAEAVGAGAVATGHYARTERALDRWLLRVAVDRRKDQTYFLFSLTQEQLSRALFPVGGMDKDTVRDEARKRGLITADKGESQGICFVGAGGVAGFLRREAPEAFTPGEIVDAAGAVLGEHQGLAAYTIGQRKGLGVAAAEPLYVIAIERAANRVMLGPRAALLVAEQRLRDCTWHLGDLPAGGLECLVRPRYRATPVRALVLAREDGTLVRYAEPQQRVNAGQACVAYDQRDEYCLGGGWYAA